MPYSIHCTVFLFLSLLVSGIGQTLWMRSALSNRFNIAIDRGYLFRGKPIFGVNKTWRGFVFMPPATGMSFLLVHAGMQLLLTDHLHLWKLSTAEYFILGCWAGLGFMIIELPNSFIKRRLNIAPGAPAESHRVRKTCFLVDQVDSIVGGLIAVWICVPVPMTAAISLLLLGGAAHYGFNVVLLYLGLRTRAA